MRRRVDPQGKSADDGESCAGERGRKRPGIVHSLRRRVSAADDRNRWPVEELVPAAVVERRRRVAYRQQRARIVSIVPRDEGVSRLGNPGKRSFEERRFGSSFDRRRDLGGYELGQTGARGAAHFLGSAKGFEQASQHAGRHARQKLQRRPCLDAGVDLHRSRSDAPGFRACAPGRR